MGFITYFTDKITKDVTDLGWGFIQVSGNLYFVFILFFSFCMLTGLYFLFVGYKRKMPEASKEKMKYVILGVSFPVIIGVPSEIILPYLGFEFMPIGSILTTIAAGFITYSLLKYQF